MSYPSWVAQQDEDETFRKQVLLGDNIKKELVATASNDAPSNSFDEEGVSKVVKAGMEISWNYGLIKDWRYGEAMDVPSRDTTRAEVNKKVSVGRISSAVPRGCHLYKEPK